MILLLFQQTKNKDNATSYVARILRFSSPKRFLYGWIDANSLFGLAQRLGRLEVRAELPSPQCEAMASDMAHEPQRVLSDPSVCFHHPRSPSFETELLR